MVYSLGTNRDMSGKRSKHWLDSKNSCIFINKSSMHWKPTSQSDMLPGQIDFGSIHCGEPGTGDFKVGTRMMHCKWTVIVLSVYCISIWPRHASTGSFWDPAPARIENQSDQDRSYPRTQPPWIWMYNGVQYPPRKIVVFYCFLRFFFWDVTSLFSIWDLLCLDLRLCSLFKSFPPQGATFLG